MAGEGQDAAAVTEVKFAFFYCMFSFWSSGLLVLVCTLSEGVEAFGSVLHSPRFLALAAAYELGKVWLAKLLSGHGASLALGGAAELRPVPARAPLLRRCWAGLRYHPCHQGLAARLPPGGAPGPRVAPPAGPRPPRPGLGPRRLRHRWAPVAWHGMAWHAMAVVHA